MTPQRDDLPADFTPEDLDEFRQLLQDDPDEYEGNDDPDFDDPFDTEEDDPVDPPDEDLEIEEQLSAHAEPDPLEELWRECDAAPGGHKRKRPERELTRQLEAASRRIHETYTRPENWTRLRGVALMHKESQTLLGNFSEYLHKDGHSKKWLRDTALIPVDGIVEVEGTWWLEPLAREHIEAAKHWQTQRSVIVACHLDRLGVFCPAAPLVLFLQFGGIMRVELSEDCMFASADGKLVMSLAKGVNVYECMEHEGKVALRQEIVI